MTARKKRPSPRPLNEPWYRATLTDAAGEFDSGRLWVAVTVLAMVGISAYDVIVNGREFKANDLGIGVGAVLTGFAAYLWGDTKRPYDARSWPSQQWQYGQGGQYGQYGARPPPDDRRRVDIPDDR